MVNKEKPASEAPLTTEQQVKRNSDMIKNLEAAIVGHQHLQSGMFVMPQQPRR